MPFIKVYTMIPKVDIPDVNRKIPKTPKKSNLNLLFFFNYNLNPEKVSFLMSCLMPPTT